MTTRMEMRVLIAKDVLRLLRPKRKDREEKRPELRIHLGSYVEASGLWGRANTGDVKTLLKHQPHCNVCALGAMFVAEVLRNNELDATEMTTWRENPTKEADARISLHRFETTHRLGKYFDSDELALIECWFEAWDTYAARNSAANIRLDDALLDKLHVWALKREPPDRLRFAMNYLIRHNGALDRNNFLKEVSGGKA